MIRILFLSISIVLMSIQVYAQEIIFPDELLNEIRVVESDKDGGTAIIVDADGNEEKIALDDIISIDEALVIEIEKGYINVKRGNTMTRMLVVYGFE